MDQGNQYEVPPVAKSCARETQKDSPTVSAYRVVQPLGFFGPDQKRISSSPSGSTQQTYITGMYRHETDQSPRCSPNLMAIYSYCCPGPQMA